MYVHVCIFENIVYAWLLKKLKMKVSEIRPQNRPLKYASTTPQVLRHDQSKETLLAVSGIFIDFQIKNKKITHTQKKKTLKMTLLTEVPHQNCFHRQTCIPKGSTILQ